MDAAPEREPAGEPPSIGEPGAGWTRGLSAEAAAAVERGLGAVVRWVNGGAAAFSEGEMDAWERELLLGSWDPGARLPLAVVARELAEPGGGGGERVAWACLCVTEWALERGAVAAGLAFAEAAAHAWPEQGRYAWTVGCLMRAHGREDAAESWLRRAAELAERAGDREGHARSLAELEAER